MTGKDLLSYILVFRRTRAEPTKKDGATETFVSSPSQYLEVTDDNRIALGLNLRSAVFLEKESETKHTLIDVKSKDRGESYVVYKSTATRLLLSGVLRLQPGVPIIGRVRVGNAYKSALWS
jgi:hypothetical protein